MLSVINRGTQTTEEVEGIPFKMVYGYEYSSHQGLPLELMKLNGVPTPFEIGIDAEVKESYLQYYSDTVKSVEDIMNIPITATLKSGYTLLDVAPKEA